MNRFIRPAAVMLSLILLTSCSTLRGIQDAMTNLTRCKFKLESVSGFSLMGVNLSDKRSLSDFSITDGVRLTAGFARGEFPASFRLNVAAINPNDGTGGTKQTSATLTSFAWTLIIDNKLTINGDIADPITIPGTGQKAIIPLQMNLDLAKFFKDEGYESVVNLAMALGGVNGSPSRITLRATPRLSTAFGDITYPGAINIIDKEFRAQ
jgi:hypothetical protein